MATQKETKNPLTDKKYSGKWVALSPDERRVLSSGKTFLEMEKSLEGNPEADKAIIALVPPAGMFFVGSVL